MATGLGIDVESRPVSGPASNWIEIRELRRTFGETIALASCSFDIRAGEVHAVMGENGSGKSTLIKLLTGILQPDSGQIVLDGAPLALKSPWEAQQRGIAPVFQETLVLDRLSIRDNILLGLDRRVRRHLSAADERRKVRETLDFLGMGRLDTERLVGSLSLAQRQIVGIARALARPWRLLILDESTSALDVEARDRLFWGIDTLRAEGRSVLFVSHRMDEIARIADRVTVMREGRSVDTLAASATSPQLLLQLMSSRASVNAEVKRAARPEVRDAPNVLEASGIVLAPGAPPWDLELKAGEIIGLAGLEGHGTATFLDIVAGRARPLKGHVSAAGLSIGSSRTARAAGIALLPRDRKNEGIFPPLSVEENISISSLVSFSVAGFLRKQPRRERVEQLVRQMRIKTPGLDAPIASLSGGNQQKALMARLVATAPKVLALNDPMRGIDMGAKQDLYEQLRILAASGVGVLLLSTELPELVLLADRVAVFHDQAVTAIVQGEALTESLLIAAMFGQAGGEL